MDIQKVEIYRKETLSPRHAVTGDKCEFTRYDAVPKESGAKCIVRFYDLPPGKANYPWHWHEAHEEVFYILGGSGIVITPDGERDIRPGDVIVCPPCEGGAHRIVNTGEETLSYLEFDAVSYPEICHYPHTGAVGILSADHSQNSFFFDDSAIDYAGDVEGAGK